MPCPPHKIHLDQEHGRKAEKETESEDYPLTRIKQLGAILHRLAQFAVLAILPMLLARELTLVVVALVVVVLVVVALVVVALVVVALVVASGW